MNREKMAYFTNFCPNCYRFIDDVRLENGIPCAKCVDELIQREQVCEYLADKNKLYALKMFCQGREKAKEFENFFFDKLNSYPWSLQITWAKRVFAGKSFAIQAPTGIGKTTFGLIMASFLEGKSYLIFPTRLLVRQAFERLSEFTDKKILAYTGKKQEKEEIERGEFDILITTHLFLYKNIEILKDKNFNFIFVDDVDSILKTARNIDYLFFLLGYNEKDLKLAMKEKRSKEEEKILEYLRKKAKGVLVVSSATLKTKTKRIALFRELLGFDVQQSVSTIRDIYDYYKLCKSWEEVKEEALKIIKIVGKGCFCFVPIDRGRDGVDEVVDFFNSQGVKAISYEEFAKREEEFVSGEIEVAVGISISTNPLVRGVDLPFSVRYALFLDVPKHIFPFRISLAPSSLFFILRTLEPFVEDSEKILSYLNYLRRYLGMRENQLDRYPRIKEKIEEIAQYTEQLLSDRKIKEKILESSDTGIIEKEDGEYIVIGDAVSYIQASGRTSRLIAGGLTKGLSIILALDRKALNSLVKRVRYYLPTETQLQELEDYRILENIKKELEKSRDPQRLKVKEKKDLLKSILVIVESPHKAKTISSFFGKPQRRWLEGIISYEVNLGHFHLVVAASVGHVTDLITEGGFFGVWKEKNRFMPVYTTIKKCECGEQLVTEKCPKCGKKPEKDKIDIIKSLRELAFEVDEVLIATDPDAEGEKISWDLLLSICPIANSTRRIEFHEVTPLAFKRALENPRTTDEAKVKAQIVRRIADRWIGFTFSQRIQEVFKNRTLSAGRVQTPVLGWVIERDKERREKKAVIVFKAMGVPFRWEIEDISKARRIFEQLEKAKVEIVERKKESITPFPPYTTSDLLRDAAEKLNFSSELVMKLAQELFEGGYITYHRTDSTTVSPYGMSIAKEFIEKNYPGYYKGRSWRREGAHECIRPTRVITPREFAVMLNSGEVDIDRRAAKLYEMIFWRFIASQMKEAEVEKVKIRISLGDESVEESFIERVIFEGFCVVHPIKIYVPQPERGIEDKELKMVPKVHPFTEGGLIEEMKKRGLGRPSTYAKIVQTLFQRRYIVKKGKYIYPTPLGIKVYNYLEKFKPYTSEEFTRLLEERMDLVESGEKEYQDVLWEIFEVRKFLPKKN